MTTGAAPARSLAHEGGRRRAFAGFSRRQRQRYRSFRRFVLAFYTRGFRELFFAPAPPVRIFRALVTSLAGYWRPSVTTRAWQALFFLNVWLRDRRPGRATN